MGDFRDSDFLLKQGAPQSLVISLYKILSHRGHISDTGQAMTSLSAFDECFSTYNQWDTAGKSIQLNNVKPGEPHHLTVFQTKWEALAWELWEWVQKGDLPFILESSSLSMQAASCWQVLLYPWGPPSASQKGGGNLHGWTGLAGQRAAKPSHMGWLGRHNVAREQYMQCTALNSCQVQWRQRLHSEFLGLEFVPFPSWMQLLKVHAVVFDRIMASNDLVPLSHTFSEIHGMIYEGWTWIYDT